MFSGIVARGLCSSAEDQRIQVATAGGGAGGQLRGGSPYPRYCRVAASDMLPEELKFFCEGVMKGATRYAGSGGSTL